MSRIQYITTGCDFYSSGERKDDAFTINPWYSSVFNSTEWTQWCWHLRLLQPYRSNHKSFISSTILSKVVTVIRLIQVHTFSRESRRRQSSQKIKLTQKNNTDWQTHLTQIIWSMNFALHSRVPIRFSVLLETAALQIRDSLLAEPVS